MDNGSKYGQKDIRIPRIFPRCLLFYANPECLLRKACVVRGTSIWVFWLQKSNSVKATPSSDKLFSKLVMEMRKDCDLVTRRLVSRRLIYFYVFALLLWSMITWLSHQSLCCSQNDSFKDTVNSLELPHQRVVIKTFYHFSSACTKRNTVNSVSLVCIVQHRNA